MQEGFFLGRYVEFFLIACILYFYFFSVPFWVGGKVDQKRGRNIMGNLPIQSFICDHNMRL